MFEGFVGLGFMSSRHRVHKISTFIRALLRRSTFVAGYRAVDLFV
ncbi:hypothetical protein RSSM_05077 [Rhodopirellula sallentina SM41]|uniref:Uncharacterized protein n=1 Tax=Rhodopirellula sallentina SM41 TaxID=1263870 RepID=M5U6G7_9BACT|nr:hypothetical protein RSSM_05077 [Rhodopirellula sallentina SM41]